MHLGSNFLGAYLVGSLATGDFDLDSDVDFLILTNAEINAAEVRSLQTIHVDIHALGCYPAEHLEGSYMSTDLLNRTDRVGVEPLWFVDNGSTSLERSIHDNRWHVRWILRERGITIFGPDPKTLLHPVPTRALRSGGRCCHSRAQGSFCHRDRSAARMVQHAIRSVIRCAHLLSDALHMQKRYCAIEDFCREMGRAIPRFRDGVS